MWDFVVSWISQFSHGREGAEEEVGSAKSFMASETGLPALTMCLKLKVPQASV